MPPIKFGTMPDGDEVVEVVIGSADLTVSVFTFGAVIRDIRLAGVDWPLVLGFERLDPYLRNSPHFGAVAGRCANRIAGGRFTLDGRPVQLSLNENGCNHIHGGFKGFDHRVWRLVDNGPQHVTLEISAPFRSLA